MTTIHNSLRTANIDRDAHWDPQRRIDIVWRGLEVIGEAGELANVCKKIMREVRGLAGSRASVLQLSEETADVVICLDLMLMTMGLDMNWSNREFTKLESEMNHEDIALTLAIAVAKAVSVSHPKNEIGGFFTNAVSTAVRMCHLMAWKGGFDLREATSWKFNQVSDKIGLPVRLEWHGNV